MLASRWKLGISDGLDMGAGMGPRAVKNNLLDSGFGRNVRAYRNSLSGLFRLSCLVLGFLISNESSADARISIVDDPKGYINVEGLFQDGSRIKRRINQGDFFRGNYSRGLGYIGCAQRAEAKGSICGSTDDGQREIQIRTINVEYDADVADCIREKSEDFNVFYRCPPMTLPIPTCKPRDSDGWKYADCELISDDTIRLLYEHGIKVRIENLHEQQDATKRYNNGLRDLPVEVPYELLGGSQTLEMWISGSCCKDGAPGLDLLYQAEEEREQAELAKQFEPELKPKDEQPHFVVEESAPQVESQAGEQENSVAKPFPHGKVRMMAVTSAGIIILIVLLVVGTTYMRSRE